MFFEYYDVEKEKCPLPNLIRFFHNGGKGFHNFLTLLLIIATKALRPQAAKSWIYDFFERICSLSFMVHRYQQIKKYNTEQPIFKALSAK